jgi:hypothetical protein
MSEDERNHEQGVNDIVDADQWGPKGASGLSMKPTMTQDTIFQEHP